MVENSIGLVTALNPLLGYEKSTEIAQEAMTTGRSVYEIVLDKQYLTRAELDDVLAPENMTRPRYIHKRADVPK
jgi:aspartate ammonia-lyase